MTYIGIVKKVNSVFPSTADVDYREVQSEELWRKVYDCIRDLGLLEKFTDDELKVIREYVTTEQKKNYHKKAVVKMNIGSDYNYGYDQNNYYFKQSVLRMKNYVLNTIITKARYHFDLVMDEFDSYDKNIGSIKEIEDYISIERIEKYLGKLLKISKEDNDYYRLELSLFVKDIFLNYGLNPSSSNLTKLANELTNRIDDVITVASNEDEHTIKNTKLAVKDLANFLHTALRQYLQNRKKDEYTVVPKEGKKTTKADGSRSLKESRGEELRSLYKQYEEQQKLLARNGRIIEELKTLEEKRAALEEELRENNRRMSSK